MMDRLKAKAKIAIIIAKKMFQLLSAGALKGYALAAPHVSDILEIIADYTKNHIDDYAIAFEEWTTDEMVDKANELAKQMFDKFLESDEIGNAFLELEQANQKWEHDKRMLEISANKGIIPNDGASRFKGGIGITQEEKNARKEKKRQEAYEFIDQIQGRQQKWVSTPDRLFNRRDNGKQNEQRQEEQEQEVP